MKVNIKHYAKPEDMPDIDALKTMTPEDQARWFKEQAKYDDPDAVVEAKDVPAYFMGRLRKGGSP